MAWRKINDTKLTAIADAIRGKTGKTAALTLDAMPTEIAGIETGPSVSGEIAITEDGTYDVSSYATANVDVVSLGTRSITANGTYDVTKYTSANVNVQSAPVLLWTNARPTSSFAAQTLSVNTDGYDGLILEALLSTSNPNFWGKAFVNNLTDVLGVIGVTNAATYAPTTRNFTVSSNAIIFKNGKTASSEGSKYCIPTRIWGVKFTL